MCVTPRASLSFTICGSTKKLTGISIDWPGSSSCSLKQKHSSLLKKTAACSGKHVERRGAADRRGRRCWWRGRRPARSRRSSPRMVCCTGSKRHGKPGRRRWRRSGPSTVLSSTVVGGLGGDARRAVEAGQPGRTAGRAARRHRPRRPWRRRARRTTAATRAVPALQRGLAVASVHVMRFRRHRQPRAAGS